MASTAATEARKPSSPDVLDTTGASPSLEGEVESPSLSTPQARARFEFEPGKANEGTKILMVEWEDDDSTRDIQGTWTIDWEGKATVLLANEQATTQNARREDQSHRMFFMLPPGVSIPATVTLTLNSTDTSKKAVVWRTNPLPAIFPPGFAETAVGGKTSKGVLHTLWAKKRLATLQSEIEKEEKQFPEGIGLDMAVQEKEWIEDSFDLGPTADTCSRHRQALRGLGDAPLSPSSPLSPGGSRLSERLKGLKLQTPVNDARHDTSGLPLHPEQADVAISSFSIFKGANPAVLAAKPAQRPAERSFTAQPPPRPTASGPVASLAGILSSGRNSDGPPHLPEDEEEQDLFALPLSPRSPEMSKSPFTFATSDTLKYLQRDQAQHA